MTARRSSAPSRVRVRVIRPSPWRDVRHAPLRAGEARDQLGRGRAPPDDGRAAPSDCPSPARAGLSRPRRRRSLSSCVLSIRLRPAERARPNSRTTCSARKRRELVDHHERRRRAALQRRRRSSAGPARSRRRASARAAAGCRRRGRSRRPLAPRTASSRSNVAAPASRRVEPRADVGLGEDRQAVAHARRGRRAGASSASRDRRASARACVRGQRRGRAARGSPGRGVARSDAGRPRRPPRAARAPRGRESAGPGAGSAAR